MSGKPRCEDIGFVHAWEDGNWFGPVLVLDPLQEPRLSRRCTNCGRRELQVVVQKEVREWREVKP